jgi:hypothetical protein
MIIMAFPCGNYSNRLFQNLHFEAFCKEYGIEYVNPSFSDIHDYYKSPCSRGSKCDFFRTLLVVGIVKILRKLKLLKFAKIFNVLLFDAADNKYFVTPPHNIYVGGWYFRVHNLTEKYQDYFIKKYTLKDELIKNSDLYAFILKQKENDNIVIGVHIGRGDYKYWCNGKYYFDDRTYKKYIYTLKDKMNHEYNKKVFFVIFSNENTIFDENEYIYKSTNEWYIDHFLMSKCDYLIGTPSTFTLWASYVGKVKYYHITNDSGNIHLDDFNCCKG